MGHLRRALEAIEDLVAVSRVYETEPLGGPPGQGDYLNVVAQLETDMGARELLGLAQRLEAAAGRRRAERWGPRTLDVDVLIVEGEEVSSPDLVVPHQSMWSRRFVLEPLAELAPDLLPAGWSERAEGKVRIAGSLWPGFPGPSHPHH